MTQNADHILLTHSHNTPLCERILLLHKPTCGNDSGISLRHKQF